MIREQPQPSAPVNDELVVEQMRMIEAKEQEFQRKEEEIESILSSVNRKEA